MRIVSLLPSATEIVCALGLTDNVVGVTHECDHPGAARSKPALTSSVLEGSPSTAEIDRHIARLVHHGSSIYRLDTERLHALRPDLVLTQELCDVCAVSYPIVERAVRRMEGATQLVSLEPETLDEVFATIATVGRLTNRSRQADALIGRLRARIRRVSAAVGGRPRRPTLCLEWIDPPYNCGHWTPELVVLAGGEALAGTPGKPARPIPSQLLQSLRPEVVVVMACGVALERSIEEVRQAPQIMSLAAGELWVVDGNAYFSRPGPRLVDSVELLARILHPEAAGAPSRRVAKRLR